MQPRKLFGSETNSRSSSRPRKMDIDTPLIKSVQYTQSRKVRHKNARTVLKKMPAGGKPYARGRKSMKKPKGAYRGAVMPRWAKGETKHCLMHDGAASGVADKPNVNTLAPLTASGLVTAKALTGETKLGLGTINVWCMNPCAQGTDAVSRNGRSIDG